MLFHGMMLLIQSHIVSPRILEKQLQEALGISDNRMSRLRNEPISANQITRLKKDQIRSLRRVHPTLANKLELFFHEHSEALSNHWWPAGSFPYEDTLIGEFLPRTCYLVNQGGALSRPRSDFKGFDDWHYFQKQNLVGQYADNETLVRLWSHLDEFHKLEESEAKAWKNKRDPERQFLNIDFYSALIAAMTRDFESITGTLDTHQQVLATIAEWNRRGAPSLLRRLAIHTLWKASPQQFSRKNLIETLARRLTIGRPVTPESMESYVKRWQDGEKIHPHDQVNLATSFGGHRLSGYYAYCIVEAIERFNSLTLKTPQHIQRWERLIQKWRDIPEFERRFDGIETASPD